MKKAKEMSLEEKKIHTQHAIRNIRRSLVLIQRAVTALTFSSDSLEGTEMNSMIEDVNISKRSLGDAIRRLSKYEENND